jgi:sugar phosphate isomerase/epimerase
LGNLEFLADFPERVGIPVSSFHGGLSGPESDFASLDEEVRLSAVAWTTSYDANIAHFLGAKYIVLHSGFYDKKQPKAQSPAERSSRRQQFLKSMAEISDSFAERGLVAAMENLGPGDMGGDVRELIDLVDEANRDNVRICLDTGHAHWCNQTDWSQSPHDPGPYPLPTPSVPEATRLIGDRLVTLHVQDSLGPEDGHRIPGLGDIDWPEFIAALRDIRYPGVFMHECDFYRMGLFDVIRGNDGWVQYQSTKIPPGRETWIKSYRKFLEPIRQI